MEKFATNKAGNIDSGTEVLSNNMVFLQEAKAQSISNLFGDLFIDGILDSGQDEYNFALTDNNSSVTNKGTFNVSLGIAYKQDVNTGLHERIAITTLTEYSNISPEENDSQYPYGTGPSQKTDIGNGTTIPTPKSSGCLNIPIPTAGVLYYVDLRYLNVCDNGNNGNGLNLKNYSIAKNVSNISTETIKRFYQWTDGYEIVLIENLSQRQGIILGTVQKDINNNVTTTTTNKSDFALLKSKLFLEYLISGGGIILTEIDNKAQLSVNVDNITTEINSENQVRVTKDCLYPYTKFAINSGPASFLATSETALALALGPGVELWLNPAYNDRYVVTSTMNITSINVKTDLENTGISIESVSSRIFTACINNTDKMNDNVALSVPKLEMMREIIVSNSVPTIYNVGDIWFDTSSQPYKVKWYKSVVDGWQDYHGVPVGLVFLNNLGGLVTQATAYTFNCNRDYSKYNEVSFMKPYLGDNSLLEDNYIIADGSEVSSLLYNDLYRKVESILTTLGTRTITDIGGQEGLRMFNLPNMTNKTFWGGNTIEYIEAGLPDIKGIINKPANNDSNIGNLSGAFYSDSYVNPRNRGEAESGPVMKFAASKGEVHIENNEEQYRNDIYGKSDTVQPPVLKSPILIKYSI